MNEITKSKKEYSILEKSAIRKVLNAHNNNIKASIVRGFVTVNNIKPMKRISTTIKCSSAPIEIITPRDDKQKQTLKTTDCLYNDEMWVSSFATDEKEETLLILALNVKPLIDIVKKTIIFKYFGIDKIESEHLSRMLSGFFIGPMIEDNIKFLLSVLNKYKTRLPHVSTYKSFKTTGEVIRLAVGAVTDLDCFFEVAKVDPTLIIGDSLGDETDKKVMKHEEIKCTQLQ